MAMPLLFSLIDIDHNSLLHAGSRLRMWLVTTVIDSFIRHKCTDPFSSHDLILLQLCLQIAITTARESRQRVIYVDTGGNFDVLRLHAILEARSCNEEV